jgi:serine acetyltransferase
VGDDAFICAGATLINNVSVRKGVTVGAGAVVIRDITEKGTYVGVPARKVM